MNIFQISTAVKYSGYYYLGAYLCKKRLENRWIIPISGLGSITLFAAYNIIDANRIAPALIRLIGLILKYMCSYMGVLFIYYVIKITTEKLINVKKSKIWTDLQKKSFGVYLFHQQIIYLTIIPLNGRVQPIVQVIVSFMCAVLASSVMTGLLKKFELTRFLYGL